jgi:hypothetical protein
MRSAEMGKFFNFKLGRFVTQKTFLHSTHAATRNLFFQTVNDEDKTTFFTSASKVSPSQTLRS